MENLRWILLIAGLVLIGLVYWNSRRRAADDGEQPPIDAPEGQRNGRVRVPPSFDTEAARGSAERREPLLSDEDLNDPLFAPTPELRLDGAAQVSKAEPVAEDAVLPDPAEDQPAAEPALVLPKLSADTVFTRLGGEPVAAEVPPAEAADEPQRETDFPPPIEFEALDFAELPSQAAQPLESARATPTAASEADLYTLEPEPEAVMAAEPESAAVNTHHGVAQPEQHFDAEPQALGNVEEKLVVLHVVASNDGQIGGTELRQLFAERGYQHGEMKIFHSCYENKTVFSIVNLVEPGYFEPEKMDDSFRTPGVTLFMRLPGPLPADVAFDVLVSEAQQMARDLGGEARDAEHATLTRQRIQHLREEVQSYIHRNRLGATS